MIKSFFKRISSHIGKATRRRSHRASGGRVNTPQNKRAANKAVRSIKISEN